MTFDTFGLSAGILRAVADQGYETPTPVQAQAIPVILEGHDMMAGAQTGTGKTAGFTLPMLQLLGKGHPERHKKPYVRALVITPTRELAAQVGESIAAYGKYLPLRSAVVFGGVGIQPQIGKLRRGVDILVATPGRLLDLSNRGAADLSQVEILVLDEADRMLDMGFIHDIRKLLRLLPEKRQSLLFSATFSGDIKKLAAGILISPRYVEVEHNQACAQVSHIVHPVGKSKKRELLSHLITSRQLQQVLVFTRTKHGANRLATQLERDGINSAAIHGNKSQTARTKALAGFKGGRVRVLVATDIAARGLDIDQLPHVVNYELPNVPEDYVHRIGRTGRAGRTGEAMSLVSFDELKLLHGIERLLKKEIAKVEVQGHSMDMSDTPPPAPGKSNRGRRSRNQGRNRLHAGRPASRPPARRTRNRNRWASGKAS